MVSAIAQDLLEVLQSEAASLLSDGWRDFLLDIQERLVRLEASTAAAAAAAAASGDDDDDCDRDRWTLPSKRARTGSKNDCKKGQLLEEASTIQVASAEVAVWVLTYEEGGPSRETEVRCAGAFGSKCQALSSSMSVMNRNCSFDWRSDGCELEDCRESTDSIAERGKVLHLKSSDGAFCQVNIDKLMFNSRLEKVSPNEWIQVEGSDEVRDDEAQADCRIDESEDRIQDIDNASERNSLLELQAVGQHIDQTLEKDELQEDVLLPEATSLPNGDGAGLAEEASSPQEQPPPPFETSGRA